MLPLSQNVLLAELESARVVLDKWITKVSEGIPGIDTPVSGMSAPGERLDVWLLELIGEVQLVSGKTANLATVLTELQSV